MLLLRLFSSEQTLPLSQGGPNSWKIAAKELFLSLQRFANQGVSCKERVDMVKDLMFLARELMHPQQPQMIHI